MNPYITREWFPMLMGCGKWRCPSGGGTVHFRGAFDLVGGMAGFGR